MDVAWRSPNEDLFDTIKLDGHLGIAYRISLIVELNPKTNSSSRKDCVAVDSPMCQK